MKKTLRAFSNLRRPLSIIVEGNIACGKTTFLNYLNKAYNDVCVLAEPVDAWRNCHGYNLLQLLYEDPKKWCFTFQSYVQLTLLQNHVMETPHPVKFMERSLYSARYCFIEKMVRDDILPTASTSVLHEWFKWIIINSNSHVDLVVYLRTNPEIAYERLKKRNRAEERCVPLNYLKDLHDLHEDWLVLRKLHSCPAPVVVLNANLDEKEITKEYTRFANLLLSQFNHLLSAS